ncbi:MAG: S-layer homology domain-containing protein [Lachnospiraceae bacterium]|nr:S-layer homology domain-containing protein [Lachnospiraceae bacterium]
MKRMLALILSAAMCFGLLPGSVFAAEPDYYEVTYINPLYSGEVRESDLETVSPYRVSAASDEEPEYYTRVSEAGAIVREAMKERQETIVVGLQRDTLDGDLAKELAYEIFNQAIEHTGNPVEGDYLAWQYAGWKGSISYKTSNGIYYAKFTYSITYYTSSEQEEEMDAAVEEVLGQLDVYDDTDYEKVKAIYDYICAHTTYDNEHLNDEDYKLKFTAYAALINGTAVCQGYAVLFYRLALELNVDSRLIAGKGNGESHAWNITDLDGAYYDLDSTWDAGKTSYRYFLKCDENFGDHTRNEEYASEEFYKAYPMGSGDYTPDASLEVIAEGTCGEDLRFELNAAGRLTVRGTKEMTDYEIGKENTPWQEYTEEIRKVRIRNGVESIGNAAFASCSNLSEVMISSDVVRIGSYAFAECSALTEVTIPATVTEIGAHAFDGCDHLTICGYRDTAAQSYAIENDIPFEDLDPEPEPTPEPENPFTDVSESDYYYDAVVWAYEKGITSGKTATTFEPDGECTRAEAVTFLWRAEGKPEPETTENPFTDVKEDAYYYKAVLWAYENGITSGTTATSFSPNSVVDRGQTVTFLWRAEGKPEPEMTENPFADVKEDAYYYKAVLWAYENKITSGVTTTEFKPKNHCIRAQIVTFLYRYMGQ